MSTRHQLDPAINSPRCVAPGLFPPIITRSPCSHRRSTDSPDTRAASTTTCPHQPTTTSTTTSSSVSKGS